jgi:hypothetical protein
MQMVSTKLSEVEEQSPEVGAAVADIFGGPGEDAGLEYLQNIKDIDLELNNLIDTSDEYTRLKQEEIAVNKKLNQTWTDLTETGGFFNQIGVAAKGILAEILGSFRDLDKVLADNQSRNNQQQMDANEQDFRAHMDRMKKALGDRYDYEQLRSNYVSNISDEAIRNQIMSLDELDEKVDTRIKKTQELQRQADEKKAEADRIKKEKEDQKKLEELRKAEEQFEKDVEKERERIQKFEEARREIMNEIELEKADSEQEAELIKADHEYQKHLNDLEKLRLTEEEKQQMILLITQRYNQKISELNKAHKKKDLETEKAHAQSKIKLQTDILNGAIYLAGQESKIGQALLAVKGVLAAKETLIQLGLLKSKAAKTAADGSLAIAEGTANTAKVGFPQNVPLLIAFAGQAIGIIAAIRGAVGAAENIKPQIPPVGFYEGGHTGSGIGYSDDSGQQIAGVVHADEYVVPKFIAQDPVYADTLGFLESRRLEGLGKGYAEGGSVSQPESSGASEALLQAIEKLNHNLENPKPSPTYIGDNEIARQEARKRLLNDTRENAKIS